MKYLRRLLWLLVLAAVGGALALFAVVQPWVAPRISHPPAADPQRLRVDVKHLSVDLYPRSYDQPEMLDLSARYIHEQLRLSGARVSYQDVTVEGASYRNVIARFGPE